MSLDLARVEAACRAWLWVPDTATTLETDEYLLVRYPDWFLHPLELVSFTPTRPVHVVLDEALERARDLAGPGIRAGSVWWWVKLGAPDGLDDLLLERGGELDETVDVFALELGGDQPDLAPAAVELRWQNDVDTVRDGEQVSLEVFGGDLPPEDEIGAEAERGREDLAGGRGGRLVAYLDGRPVGSAGLTLADGVARLWGGGVVEAARGRGVYRALLAARLRHATEQDAGLALVKGRIQTSGPILRRAGFEVFGQERSYRVPLA